MAYLPAGTDAVSPVATRPEPIAAAKAAGVKGSVWSEGIPRRDDDQPVAEKIEAALGLDEMSRGEVVHGVEVGRGEEVGRRALLDLFGEREGTRIGNVEVGAVRGLVGGCRVVERIFQARGREDGDAVGRPRQRLKHEEPTQSRGGQGP